MIRLAEQGLFDGGRGPTLVIAGANGRLAVERLQLVMPPLLVDVPLTGGVVQVAPESSGDARRITLYRDGVDERDREHIIELVALLRTTYPAFPVHAHAVVHGWFTPTDGRAPRRFVAYLDPAIEPRIALPDDAKSLSAAPRGRAARQEAGLRAAAALRGVTRSVMRDAARARAGAWSGDRTGTHSGDRSTARSGNRAVSVSGKRSEPAVHAWALRMGLQTGASLERASA